MSDLDVSDEVLDEAVASLEGDVAEPQAKRRRRAKQETPTAPQTTASRAKPLYEEQAEREAEDKARARELKTLQRAKPRYEEEQSQTRGDPLKTVTCRVLNKGEGRIQTGEIDEETRRPTFFAAGALFDQPEPQALQNEAKGYVEITHA